MRRIPGVIVFAAVFLLSGCSNGSKWGGIIRGPQPAPPAETPTAAALVDYLNRNAKQLQSLECQERDLDCRQGLQVVGLRGKMVCQRPKNFRLGAQLMGSQAVDMGSNNQEFWYWISKADPPYLFHCSYGDLQRGGVRMPFPFQPEWIMEA